ncbi:hypothetical protein [Streptomyces sp. NPDC090057]|uniref:hypothetical protein n=1 Tax=Streptomyces sp. NPDC090057 TaxID=3365935 RepID=UPI0037FD1E55
MTNEAREAVADVTLKVLAFIFGAGAFAFSILGGDENERRPTYITYGVICLGVTTIIAYIESGLSRRSLLARERLAVREVRAQEEVVTSVSAAAIHLARIGGLRSTHSHVLAGDRGRLEQAICTAASRVHPGSRAAFYTWNSSRFECTGIWAGAPKVTNTISPGDSGFPDLRHVLRTGGVFKKENVRSYLDGFPSAAAQPDSAILLIPVRAGQEELGVLAVDAKMESWESFSAVTPGYSDSNVRNLLLLADLLASGLK